ncbi:unnamed protein product [Vitrella brassicaformis CCMP3155]|uniref:Uncharacterized protein n=1 Tax=Vitrella brassicaformis (strain CCMP3155) TaxID=1169540 RepID=A0A0G4EQ59_VITBC|nr:unnamed protein product [Vitrella brassicaformis CCMP3155]|eukprot:CEL99744.1 unnamed protein product [Vitrella brassicaformis CCMP3155]
MTAKSIIEVVGGRFISRGSGEGGDADDVGEPIEVPPTIPAPLATLLAAAIAKPRGERPSAQELLQAARKAEKEDDQQRQQTAAGATRPPLHHQPTTASTLPPSEQQPAIPKPSRPSPAHPPAGCTFRPQLTRIASRIQREGPVHERLYALRTAQKEEAVETTDEQRPWVCRAPGGLWRPKTGRSLCGSGCTRGGSGEERSRPIRTSRRTQQQHHSGRRWRWGGAGFAAGEGSRGIEQHAAIDRNLRVPRRGLWSDYGRDLEPLIGDIGCSASCALPEAAGASEEWLECLVRLLDVTERRPDLWQLRHLVFAATSLLPLSDIADIQASRLEQQAIAAATHHPENRNGDQKDTDPLPPPANRLRLLLILSHFLRCQHGRKDMTATSDLLPYSRWSRWWSRGR